MTGTAVPAFADVYDIRKGSITIVANGDGTAKVTQNETVNDKDDDVKVTGSNEVTGNTVDIINNTDNDLKVTLSDVTITDPKGDAAPVSVSGTGNTAIELDGSNTLKSSGWHAGLERNEEKNSDGNVVSGKLTIQQSGRHRRLRRRRDRRSKYQKFRCPRDHRRHHHRHWKAGRCRHWRRW